MEPKELKSSEYKLLIAEIRLLRKIGKQKSKALKLQAKEYERRLEILNHEAQKLATMQATYMPREVYVTEQYEQDKKIGALSEWKSKSEGGQVVRQFVWGIVIVLLSAVLSYFARKI